MNKASMQRVIKQPRTELNSTHDKTRSKKIRQVLIHAPRLSCAVIIINLLEEEEKKRQEEGTHNAFRTEMRGITKGI